MSASLVGSEMCIRDSDLRQLPCMGQTAIGLCGQRGTGRHLQPTGRVRSFVYDKVAFHCLGRCARWRAAKLVPSETGPCLSEALDELWVSVRGPARELIMGGEGGIA
eukprot:13104869-Alexandrium_andersonii.AAC.1